MANPQPGWYADPSGDPSKLRWWDGTKWTDDYAAAQQAAPVSDATAAQQPQQPYVASGMPPQQAVMYAPAAAYAMTETDRTLRMVAFILNLVSLISMCWLIIPLAWMIPMTVRSWGIYKGTKPNTTAFGVCDLIFLNMVGGILLLVSQKDA